MRVEIGRCVPQGSVRVPSSKSIAHRYLIAAALTRGTSVIRGLPDNLDVRATVDCLRRMGAEIEIDGETATLNGEGLASGDAWQGERPVVLDCAESGTTLRLLLPVALLTDHPVTFCGTKRLFSRPLGVYEDICRELGLKWERCESSVSVCGPLRGGDFSFPGNISSQFVSGLLLALPHVAGDSVIRLTTAAESASYIDLTLHALQKFGIGVGVSEGEYRICGGQSGRTPGELCVPTDQSAAAFFGALAMLGGNINMVDFVDDGVQGDRVWRQYMERICRGRCTLSVADCPDLAPVLMALAALCDGVTLLDTARLRFKESDRGAAMAEELAKFGVGVTCRDNEIIVGGGARTPDAVLSGHNDHRIAMSLAVVACAHGGVIDGAECVAKSLPEFWKILMTLGADVRILG